MARPKYVTQQSTPDSAPSLARKSELPNQMPAAQTRALEPPGASPENLSCRCFKSPERLIFRQCNSHTTCNGRIASNECIKTRPNPVQCLIEFAQRLLYARSIRDKERSAIITVMGTARFGNTAINDFPHLTNKIIINR